MVARLVFSLFTVLLTTMPLYADPISLVGSAGSGWHSYAGAGEDNTTPGTPFWDSNSWDTKSTRDGEPLYNPANIGALLEGRTANLVPIMQTLTGVAAYNFGPDAPLSFDFWGEADNTADPNFYFTQGATTNQYAFVVLSELAARMRFNEFGWYSPSDPLTLHTIFPGSAGRFSAAVAVITGDFGFYYFDTLRGLVYLTQTGSPLQTPGGGQQFAAFRGQNAQRYFIGVEDRPGPITGESCGPGVCSDYDYQDFVVAFQQFEPPPNEVPEPGTVLLLGTGLIGAVGAARRRRQATRR